MQQPTKEIGLRINNAAKMPKKMASIEILRKKGENGEWIKDSGYWENGRQRLAIDISWFKKDVHASNAITVRKEEMTL